MYHPYSILKQYKEEGKTLTFTHNEKPYTLEPVTNTPENVETLAAWRDKFYDAFPARFKVTLEGTKNWLQNQVIDNEDRFLFMIKDGESIVGHLGFFRFDQEKNSCEIDNVVKGSREHKGIMTSALNRVLEFGFDELKMDIITLRVFSDNERAVSLYERCGMSKDILIPLKREGNDLEYAWKEIENEDEAERFFLQMYINNPAHES